MKTSVVLLVLSYICCAASIASLFFAYFQRKFPSVAAEEERSDVGAAWMMGLILGVLGPFGVLTAYFMTGLAEYGSLLPWIRSKP